jgi:hypothetical protein
VGTPAAAVRATCARLRGEPVLLSAAMIDAAREHRVHLLVAESLSADERHESGAAARLEAELQRQAIVDALRERELRRTLDAFAAAGIQALVLKGAALARTVYPAPHLRPHADVDLLIAPEHLDAVDRLLGNEGWTRDVEPDFSEGAAQRHYRGRRDAAVVEHLDVHWKIANPRVFGDAFTFEELWRRSVPIRGLGADARTLGAAHTLLLACLHRVAHHDDAGDLLWLWDIHLITSALSSEDRAPFLELAAGKKMRAICARGLRLAAECFETPGAAGLVAELQDHSAATEPTARFIGGRMRFFDIVRADLAATPAWRARVALIREHLFPSRRYMRSTYSRWPAALLPFAYAHRILHGAPKWLRRPGK